MKMARPVLANLGFILQISGMIMVLPIILGFYLKETQPLIAYFTTTIIFFGAGFLFNAFSKREDMDFKSSALLVSSIFFLLGLIGAIPYLYLDTFPGPLLEKFTNSFLESISGYTTAGISLIENIDALPESLVFYRSLTQWIGGVGIIFVLLAFFYPSGETLRGIGRMLGLDKFVAGMKLILSHILLLYTLYALAFIGVLYLIGFTDFLITAPLILSSFATGGLSPLNNFDLFTNSPALFVIIAAMILGALNFFVHDKIIRANLQNIFKTELLAFIAILVLGVLLFYYLSGLSLKDAAFNAISASTTSGFSTVDIHSLNDAAKLVLIFLMFVGGMTFSTAGGLKVLRLVMFLKSVPWIMHRLVHNVKKPLMHDSQEIEEADVNMYMILPALVVGIVFVSIFVFVLHGFSISDALFESISSYSLTGFTTGLIDLSSPLTLKWWLILLVVIGRVEIIAFLFAMVSRRMLHKGEEEK